MHRNLVLAIIFFTGFTGLVYEVTWHRYLANLLGSQAQATAIILAVFLGGLSVGYLIFGKLSEGRSARFLIKLCGWSEIGIAAWAFLFPSLFDLVWAKIGLLPQQGLGSLLIEIHLTVFLIGLPTVLMGGTLPLLTQALVETPNEAGEIHAKIYGVNTIGAFLGCLLAGFWIVPELGLPLTILNMGIINLLAGLALVGLGRRFEKRTLLQVVQPENAQAPDQISLDTPRCLALALLSGFIALSFQTALIRLVGLTVGASEYAFSMIVAVFILMLALGALTLKPSQDPPAKLLRNQLLVLAGTLALYLSVPHWPYVGHLVRAAFASSILSFYAYYFGLFLVLCLVLALPVGMMGKTMPLVFVAARSQATKLGGTVGNLYATNALGCIVGALIGGYIALYWLDLEGILKAILGSAILTVLLLIRDKPERPRWILPATLCAGLLATWSLPSWPDEWLGRGLFRMRTFTARTLEGHAALLRDDLKDWQLLDYVDGPNTTVSIFETKEYETGVRNRSIYVNGKSDGSTGGEDLRTTTLLAQLPALLHAVEAQKHSAAVIGYGTGISVGSLTPRQEIDRIDVIEISPFVRSLAERFDAFNDHASKDAKVHWSIGDAYRVLGASNRTYSMIVSEPSNPWVVGVEKLYSKEFFEIVKTKLKPGGVYAQWFHIYSIGPKTFDMVLNTYSQVFPHVRVFGQRGDVILLGSDRALGEDLEALTARYSSPETSSALAKAQIQSLPALLGLESWYDAKAHPRAGFHTLEKPRLAFRAGIDFFAGRYTELSANPSHEVEQFFRTRKGFLALLPRQISASPERLEEILAQAVPMLCDRAELGFFPGWERSSVACRSGLLRWALESSRNRGDRIAEMVRAARYLRKSEPPEELLTMGAVNNLISFFGAFHSALLPLNARRLLHSAVPCYRAPTQEGRLCRSELVRTLLKTGHATEAQSLLGQFSRDPQMALEPSEASAIANDLSEISRIISNETTTTSH